MTIPKADTVKFTPPETFPHECFTNNDLPVILHAKSQNSAKEYIGEWKSKNGWVPDYFIADQLRDLPKVTSTWQNVNTGSVSPFYYRREDADMAAHSDRIAVLRRDTVDRVTTCHLEDA